MIVSFAQSFSHSTNTDIGPTLSPALWYPVTLRNGHILLPNSEIWGLQRLKLQRLRAVS